LNYTSFEIKSQEQTGEAFFFKLQMNPSVLGQVNIDGFYNQNNIRVNFSSESNTKEIIRDNSENLSSNLRKNAKLSSSISANVFGHKTTPGFFQLYTKRNINVKA
jgi:hypothetical protein